MNSKPKKKINFLERNKQRISQIAQQQNKKSRVPTPVPPVSKPKPKPKISSFKPPVTPIEEVASQPEAIQPFPQPQTLKNFCKIQKPEDPVTPSFSSLVQETEVPQKENMEAEQRYKQETFTPKEKTLRSSKSKRRIQSSLKRKTLDKIETCEFDVPIETIWEYLSIQDEHNSKQMKTD